MTRVNNNRRGTVAITIIIILAVALATIFIFRAIYSNNQPDTSDNNDTSHQDNTVDIQPDSTGDDTSSEEPDITADDDTPVQYEGADPNSSSTVEAVLTYYGIQNGEYIVNVNIPQYLSGTCHITLGSYTGSVTIDQSAASSACSFHIPVSQLQSGLQALKVNIQSSAATGTLEETIDVSL